jgi:hypothetical protein
MVCRELELDSLSAEAAELDEPELGDSWEFVN